MSCRNSASSLAHHLRGALSPPFANDSLAAVLFLHEAPSIVAQAFASVECKDLDAFIEVLFNSSNKKSDDKIENENEIAATLSMMNRFVTLLGKYSFCPSLHRSTPGVTNATEIWKPLDSTTTSSSRNFERGGKRIFLDALKQRGPAGHPPKALQRLIPAHHRHLLNAFNRRNAFCDLQS